MEKKSRVHSERHAKSPDKKRRMSKLGKKVRKSAREPSRGELPDEVSHHDPVNGETSGEKLPDPVAVPTNFAPPPSEPAPSPPSPSSSPTASPTPSSTAGNRNSWLKHSQKDQRKKEPSANEYEPLEQSDALVREKQRTLENFLLATSVKKLRGTTWKYFDLGKKNWEVIVLLHGGGIRPEAMYEQITLLSQEYRVIAPWFPAELNDMEDYVEGVVLIMRHENVRDAFFYGFGFGGSVAQYLLFLHPERVLGLILSHVDQPNDTNAKPFEKFLKKVPSKDSSHQGTLSRFLAGWGVKPKDLEKQVKNLHRGEKDLWMHILKKFSASKEAITARVEAMRNYHRSTVFSAEDFSSFRGRVLLIESKDDEGFDAASWRLLTKSFPAAQTFLFEGGGNLVGLVRARQLASMIIKFLEVESESGRELTE